MKSNSMGFRFPLLESLLPSLPARIARTLIFKVMTQLRVGSLRVIDKEGSFDFAGSEDPDFLKVTIEIKDPRFYAQAALGGTVGVGEAYMEGHWSCDNIPGLVHIIVRNRSLMEELESRWAIVLEPFQKFIRHLRRNTLDGSKRNIAAHYDLSNEFFSLWLDETMTYSCAVFEKENDSLRKAQLNKIDRICRKLRLGPKDHLLEIGSGWGALSLHAAGRYGCRVTTATISEKQFEFVQRRIRASGLQKQVKVLHQDYRKLRGSFDKLVSVEMIEAVGHAYFEVFFKTCARLLKPDGRLLLQTITIADRHYAGSRDSVDFIKKHIFPGSCIPSVTALLHSATRASDLKLVDLEDLSPHYSITLRRWRENFMSRAGKVSALGFPQSFLKMWEFYLALCEGGFDSGHIGDVQMMFSRSL